MPWRIKRSKSPQGLVQRVVGNGAFAQQDGQPRQDLLREVDNRNE